MEIIITEILSVLLSVEDENELPVAPLTGVPLISHWYEGLTPPLVGVAVKVTFEPAHIVFPPAALMRTEVIEFGFTVMVPVATTAPQPPVSGIL